MGDEDVIRIIQRSKQASKFEALWRGDTGDYGGDDSAADLALCNLLAFYCDGPDQVDRIFRSSGLIREKWDSRRGATTYGAITVERAWSEQTDHYKPHVKLVLPSALAESSTPLDRDLWTARPELKLIETFALSRRAAPAATLGVVLARIAAATPPAFVLPPLIGDVASLNPFIAMVGASGSGKGAAERAATAAVRFGPHTPFDSHRPGSGQGLAHAYRHVEKHKGEPPRMVRHASAAYFSLDEVDTLRGLFGQQGSTLMPELRSLAMGERLGHLFVDPEKRIEIPDHTYRAALVVGVQPERAGALLDDVAGGTPQRFLWLPTTYPHPDQRPDEVAPLEWCLPRVNPDAFLNGRYIMPVCETAVMEIDAAHLARARGEGDALDGHLLLTQEKFAATLALLSGHAEITEEDWQLASVVMDISASTRALVVEAVAAVKDREDQVRALRQVRLEGDLEEAQQKRAFLAAQRQVVNHVTKHAVTEGCRRRCIHNAIAGKYRINLSLDEVLTDALARLPDD